MPLTKTIPIPEPPPIENKLEDRRLWIGNLDTAVSEYQLLKILQKHGNMEKFDLLFHRSGPLAGQHRGYAFVTYSTSEQAKQMKDALDGKRIGVKNIAVRWAHSLSLEERDRAKVVLDIPALTGAKTETKISRATKIQAIEAKLKLMEKNSLNSEFSLNDGPSGNTSGYTRQNTNKGKFNKSFSKTKPYTRSHYRR